MSTGKFSISADFLGSRDRQLFYILLSPAGGPTRPAVLYLPPFAEEMHMARHVAAAQARALAAAGHTVMLPDLSGCGDASGDFGDASWQHWLEDAGAAADFLKASGGGQLVLWGLRMGCLLAGALAAGRDDVARLLFWQPVLNGEQQIDQFLRVAVAASALSGGGGFDRAVLWQALRDGQHLPVAGYALSPELALPLGKERLANLSPACDVDWLEITPATGEELSPAAARVVERWCDAGVDVRTARHVGTPFWRSTDHAAQVDTSLVERTMTLVEAW
ncbi:MAG: hydrolase 2, exosortase A system-associated [Halioglobus sp.]|nr:hydrolase 2, exosortase A system-associated [Halioglobus sp.]